MTGTVSFPWIDGGKKLEVRKIPINGERELKHLMLDHAKLVTLQKNSFVYTFHQIVIETKKVLTADGVNAAKDAWEQTLRKYGMMQPDFNWPHEEWLDSFLSYYETHTLRHLKATSVEDAESKVIEKIREISDEIDTIDVEAIRDFEYECQLIELYWRLKACGAKSITPAGGKPSDLAWDRESRSAIVDILGDYADSDVIAAFRSASGGKKARIDMDDYTEADEDEMRGKSEPASKASTKSSGASPPSSEPTTADKAKLEISETRSG